MGRRNNNRMSMPSTGAGITRYFDDYHTSIEFKPAHILVIILIIAIAILLLHYFGGSIIK
jgi:preprotein translocase subunit Sec61beta